MRRAYRAAAAGAVLVLAACGAIDTQAPAPVEVRVPPAAPAPPGDAAAPAPAATMQRPGARWMAARWDELPGWAADRPREAWTSLQRSCERPGAELRTAWARVCADALRSVPPDDAAARAWLEARLQPWRVLPLEANAPGEGLATGYFEPLVEASRVPRGALRHPLHAVPADLATRRPWFTRGQIDSLPAAQAALRGREIAYVADPLDVLLLQVQGSGRLRVTEADGRVQTVRVAYAGHNDHPYVSVGRWLIDQGELRAGEASWPAIREWARRNPARVPQLLAANPRVVFFREEPLPDPALGPRGSQGVALVPERSIAVDPTSVPLGTPVWLDTTEPLSATPLRRLVLAQDTGSAITGAVRADYFWGWGERAEAQAGRMKQPLRMWALWPRPDGSPPR
ncbi:MAG TPA: MltA domain-containing protein [Burkholderiaceae bacterium]|nr:MltA domain-containing protein [Burkholderiaceae bacterium]